MKITRKKLRQIIEGVMIPHSKIAQLSDRYIDDPNLYIRVNVSSDKIAIKMFNTSGPKEVKVGEIDLMKHSVYSGHAKNKPCLDAYVIYGFSKMDADYNLGPVLYDIGLELAGKHGLMADRRSVSDEAIDMWYKYLNMRNDVQVRQLDHDFVKRITKNMPKWTPETYDDCNLDWSLMTYIKKHGTPPWMKWSKSDYNDYKKWATSPNEDPLSKVFYKYQTPIIDYLQRQNRIDINYHGN